jgi:predicted PhzF superfamily epimerase YddE/YHI9
VGSEEVLRGITPDFSLLAKVECRGVIVTCGVQSGGYDFASRFFAPAVGINEDPVTGSAHCSLAPFWSGRTGRNSFTARQASERGGTLKVRAAGERTFIAGQAVTVVRGETAPLFD